MRRCRHVVACAATIIAAACSSTPTATFTVTTGDETDALTRAPAPTTLVVDALDLDGNAQEIARTPLPTDTLALGDKQTTDVGAIRVSALDATGKALVRGETLYVQFGALEDAPISVFVQRLGELARMPGASALPVLDGPKLAVTNARYVIAASGTNVVVYDLLLLRPLSGIPSFPRPARSLVAFGTAAAVVIDEQGATAIDLSTADTSTLAPPDGGTFAEIAGGSTVNAPDGSAYVIGGTRTTGGPSQRVLAISKDGAVTFATLAVPREGACAAWVEGRGLVVVGGNVPAAPSGGGDAGAGGTGNDGGGGTNATAPGAEVMAPGAVQGAPLPYPADGVKACGASALDASHVLVAGGVGSTADVMGAAPARVLDLACASMCTPAVWPGPMPLVRAESFTLGATAALVAGDDATGATRVFRATATGSTEIAVKAPRKNARLVALPVKGTAAIVGGAAPFEQYAE